MTQTSYIALPVHDQRNFSARELAELRQSLASDGYVVVDGLAPESMLGPLRDAAEAVTQKARSGRWPHKRTVGKQFPPWNDANPDVWGVQHVMHPDLHPDASIFIDFYSSPALLKVVTALMGGDESNVMMALFNLLVEPQDHGSFGLSWHRDHIKSSVDQEEERKQLAVPRYGVQWNLALWKDDCLMAVPGSHLRIRTAEERAATSDPTGELPMPGAKVIHLEPGQAVFYDAQILHRGTYDATKRRATLHGLHSDSREPTWRGGGILQHGTEWMASPRFEASLDIDRAVTGRLSDGDSKRREIWSRAVEWSRRAREEGYDYAQENI